MSHNLLQAGMSAASMQQGVNQSVTQQLRAAGSDGVGCQHQCSKLWISGAHVPLGAVPLAMSPQCPPEASQECLISQVRNKNPEYTQAGVL